MHFDFCIGNPPYQDGKSNERLYPYFYKAGIDIANCVEMIFPNAWRNAKSSNGLSVLNNVKVKKDKQIVFIKDEHNVFNNVSGAEWTNIILWKRGFDNLLLGKQKVIDERGNVFFEELPIDKSDVKKPDLIVSVVNKVNKLGEPKVYSLVSSSKPYGFRSDPLDNPAKYGLTLYDNYFDGSVRLYGLKSGKGRCSFYIDRALLPKESPLLDSYKLFVVKAWGNMDEKKGYLGGSYSDVILANPLDCCTEMYIEVGPFANKLEASNAKKYFCTKFFRSLFYMNKYSQNTAKDTYASVPIQDFTDKSAIDWSKEIYDIDLQLYRKYHLSNDEILFIERVIKIMEGDSNMKRNYRQTINSLIGLSNSDNKAVSIINSRNVVHGLVKFPLEKIEWFPKSVLTKTCDFVFEIDNGIINEYYDKSFNYDNYLGVGKSLPINRCDFSIIVSLQDCISLKYCKLAKVGFNYVDVLNSVDFTLDDDLKKNICLSSFESVFSHLLADNKYVDNQKKTIDIGLLIIDVLEKLPAVVKEKASLV